MPAPTIRTSTSSMWRSSLVRSCTSSPALICPHRLARVSLFERPATWPELGLMQGTPPPAERLVTSSNWIEGPFNRWGFLHVRELAHTARIGRGDGPVHPLPADPRDLGAVPVAFEGTTVPFAQTLHDTYVDGLCVVHDGAIVFEHYVDGMRPEDPH